MLGPGAGAGTRRGGRQRWRGRAAGASRWRRSGREVETAGEAEPAKRRVAGLVGGGGQPGCRAEPAKRRVAGWRR